MSTTAAPIRYYLTPELMPDAATQAELERLARLPELAHHVAVLPDVHRKARNPSPTGTVIATRNALVPRAVDTGINCGIRMLGSSVDVASLSVRHLDRLFAELREAIPLAEQPREVLSRAEVTEILGDPAGFCRRRFGVDEVELGRIEDGGRVDCGTDDLEAIAASVPERAARRGPRCFGTLGGGNHFLELQEVVEILEPEAARLLGIERGKAVFMLHTGSRNLGSKTMKHFLERMTLTAPAGPAIQPLPVDSEEGTTFARAIAGASHFGFANRIAISAALRAALRTTLSDPSLELPLLFDCGHVSIKRERWNGEWLWVHRHGASRALPPSRWDGDPVFARIGQPVPIPGSMGHDSFIGVAAEGALEAYCSVNHGAGRQLDKPEAAARFTAAMVEDEMRSRNIRLYRYGSGDIAEQAPGAFKDISEVVRAMATLKLARPVARVTPVAVLKE
ncbi:MAG TPA: RtcB family protein [Candidatus Eisenbacteria bacterium]|jgi:tRNA-splicing ligase RtcB